MIITYNLDEAKQRVISLIKQNAYDFCSDMFKEIKAAANNDDINEVENFTTTIRQVESTSEQQIKSVEKANNIVDILNYTANESAVGNVLYECHDQVLGAIFQVKIEEQFSTDEELPF